MFEATPIPDHATLGVGVVSTPGYQGSGSYRTTPIPVIDIRHGSLFANLADGVGVDLLRDDTITVGASIKFMPGYRRQDVPAGIDRLSNAAGARLFTRLKFGGVLTTFGVTRAFGGGTEGLLVDANIARPIHLSPRFTLIPGISSTWADRRYSDHYFGITQTEAAASGLASYRAGAGFKDVNAGATGIYRLNRHLSLSGTVLATRLLGDAADSPLVAHRTRPTGLLSIAYTF